MLEYFNYEFIIVDGSWLARSKFASGTLPHGFMDVIVGLEKRCKEVIIVWDTFKSRDLRIKIFPQYKQNRQPTPEDYAMQVRLLRNVHLLDRVQCYPEEGEGDDAMYSLSLALAGKKGIYSIDKDMLQAVNCDVDVIRPSPVGSINIFNIENFKRRIGMHPEQMPLFLALAGDTADNIPGIRGIGKKKAMDIIKLCPWFLDLMLEDDKLEDEQTIISIGIAKPSLKNAVKSILAQKDFFRLMYNLVKLKKVEVTLTRSN